MSAGDLEPNWPVLVGVGTCFDDVEAAELMVRSTVAAGVDCGADSLLRDVERIVVPHGTWSYRDPARIVSERIGASHATTVLVDVGIPQQTILDDAMTQILAGDIDIVIITGAEAKARAARLRASSTKGDAAGMAAVFSGGTDEAVATETDQGDLAPDEHQRPVGDLIDPAELAAGLYAPVDQYALIESAFAAHVGVSVRQNQADVARLWASFNEVARQNPHAAFRDRWSASELATPSSKNRPLAFPYNKWLVSQWTVDQGVSLILCSVAAARRAGVDESRWVHPLVGLGSSHMLPLTQRRDLHRWPAMQVLGEHAESHLGHPLSDCGTQELYSCFPVAVRIQQRELGLPLDGVPTVTGGMTFAGGPFNSFMFQALADAAAEVRSGGGRALVTSVSGLLTKPGLGVWAAHPDENPPLIADLGSEVAERTRTRKVDGGLDAEAEVVAATVTYDGLDPAAAITLVEDGDGVRSIARTDDRELVSRALDGGGLVASGVRTHAGRLLHLRT